MAEQPTKPDADWDATWGGVREQLLRSPLAATPAQRLAWLEEVLELAYRAGALSRRNSSWPAPIDPGLRRRP